MCTRTARLMIMSWTEGVCHDPLQGRAYLEARIKLKEKRYNNVEGGVMKIVVDGYNAPVTAGAFVDLVEKKFYDGMEVQRSDGLVVQTGRPEGDVSHLSSILVHKV